MRGDVAEEMADRSERKVVGLELVLDRHGSKLRDKRIVTADNALEQSLVREPVDPVLPAIARCGSEQECEAARMTGCQKAPFERNDQLVRYANADEPLHRDRIAVFDDGDRRVGADDLVLELQSAILLRSELP